MPKLKVELVINGENWETVSGLFYSLTRWIDETNQDLTRKMIIVSVEGESDAEGEAS